MRLSLLAPALVLCLSAATASAVLPLPIYPQCGEDGSVAQCPPDLVHGDGTWRGGTWEFVSFIPPGMEDQVRREELALGSGNHVDRAWRLTTGRFDVPIAILDSGILWDNADVASKVWLNRGELKQPRRADGSACASWDCDGNGLLTTADYAADARVAITAGDDPTDDRLDPSDLIVTFSDGVDGDGNAYVDDIAGWDFLWDDNNPYASNGFDHGTGVMEQAAAEGGRTDSDIGVCPNCAILPIRSGDSFIADADRLAAGILYATDLGAKVIAMASGTVNNTSNLHEAVRYAWEHGVFVVSAIGDELSYHHLYPGAADYLMAVHSIFFWPPTDWDKAQSFLSYNGCNNYGSHLTIVAGTNACATGATAITAGAAGLLISLGRDLGRELHPDDVRALLTSTATDINVTGSGRLASPYFPSSPGWDLFFGYGRIDVGLAAERLAAGLKPPRVHLTGPGWFDFVDAATTPRVDVLASMGADSFYDWSLQWAPGGRPTDSDFAVLAAGSQDGDFDGVLTTWDLSRIPVARFDASEPMDQVMTDMDVPAKFDAANLHAVTLRLVATDARGSTSEMRKTFFIHEDPDLVPGFPIDIGASGEAPPFLADLDGDGVLDILVGAADGVVHAFGADGRELPGWPVAMPLAARVDPADPAAHFDADAYALGVPRPRSGVLGGTVAADLDGDGELEVVIDTMDGEVYVYQADGRPRPGFPVARDPVGEEDTDPLTWLDPGLMSTPLTVDLDGDGALEIVVAAMDQQIYVWREDGSRQPGWPVKLEQASSDRHVKGRIVSTPAAADFDGDGQIDIVVGSNEWDPELYVPSWAYAVSGRGNLEPRGAILPGWPAQVPGALNGLVPWIGEGVPVSPAVGDIDEDGLPEVVMSGVLSCPHRYEHDGKRTVQYHCNGLSWGGAPTQERGAIAMISNATLADVDQDGDLDVIVPLSGLDYGIALGTSTWVNYQDHFIGLWDGQSGDVLPGWPVVIEDIGFFMRPGVADVDGDGSYEVLAGSGGQTVHAYDLGGLDVPGWPKVTGGWVVSAIAAGDITGDGRSEVVVVTREGYVFAWETQGEAMPPLQGMPWTEGHEAGRRAQGRPTARR